MTTLLAVIATMLIIPAMLGLLLNAGFSGLFFASPPRGDSAVGLVVPLVINISAIIAFTVAALLLALRPGETILTHLHGSAWLTGTLAVVLALGGSLAAFMAFLLWCEPAMLAGRADFLRVVAGWLGSIVGPLLLALFLLLYAWLSPTALANSPAVSRAHLVLTASVSLLALAGFAGGITAFGTPLARGARESAAKARAAVANAAGSSPLGRPLDELLQRDMDVMTADTPLSRIIAFLPNTPDTIRLNKSCKQIVIERALRIPPADLDRQLAECMRSPGGSYHDVRSAAEFIATVDDPTFAAHAEPWSRALVAGIEKCTNGIETRPAWLREQFNGNSDPHATIAALLTAAERCKPLKTHALITAALQRLADATNDLEANAAQRKLQTSLTKAGYSPAPLLPAP